MKRKALLAGANMASTEKAPAVAERRTIAQLEAELAQARAALVERTGKLAKRTAERDEALAREVAATEVLQVINASPGDLTPVFDAILEKAHALCGVTRGGLALYDGDAFRVVALHGYPPAIAELMRRPFRANPIHQRMVDGERYLHIPDVRAFSGQLADPVAQAVVDAGARTWLGISLVKDGKFLGHIFSKPRRSTSVH